MSVDRTKVLEAAQKFLAKGNYDKAIGELRKIVSADPNDARTWLKIGDLYTRKGARKEAIETYAKVGQQYGEQGFFLKAVAVYKQILKLDPSRLDIQLLLAEQYEQQELTSDALATYEHVAASYARAGDVEKALSTLAKMTELDPQNIPVRIKYAEALSKAGRTKDAASEFEAGALLLREQGRIDDFMKVGERLLFHRPTDVDLARELAQLYLDRDDAKRALGKLQLVFKADPKHVPTLELLAEAFRKLGQLPKTLSVYQEVARIHQDGNRPEERAKTLKRILELDPANAEARQALASFAQTATAPVAPPAAPTVRRDIAPPASAVVEPKREAARPREEPPELDDLEMVEEADDDEVSDDDLIIVDEESAVQSAPPVAASEAPTAQAPGRSIPPDVQREAQIARLLTETDVFMRYGLKQKVVEQLRAVLEIDPLHVEAREKLKDALVEQGKIPAAISELVTLADIFMDEQSPAAMLYLQEILALDPNHTDARERLERLRAASGSNPSVVPIEPAEIDATPEELAPPMPAGPGVTEDAVFFVDEESTDLSSPDTREQVAAWRAQQKALDASEAATKNEARPAIVPPPSARAVAVPPPSALGVDIDDPAEDPLAPMTPEEFDEVPLRPSVVGDLPPQRMSITGGEVEELLDEADFFVAQGLFEEARGILNDALENHPGHPLIAEKLREVNQVASVSPPPERSVPPPPIDEDQAFELAEKLAEEFAQEEDATQGSDVLDVEQVFAQFKKGVEQQVGAEDTETHFDLGIAYKEMGLLDDAMNEFRLCASNPARVCIAETMIGLCFIEKGDVAEAITHFKKGLYADTRTEREELGLYFELGHAYELLHDPKEALYYYQKVQKRDPTFRDVGRRIQNLAQPQASVVAPAPMAPDDIDRAFDDLMGED